MMASSGVAHDVIVRKIGRLAVPLALAALVAARSGLGSSGWVVLLLAAGLFVIYLHWSDATVTRISH
jgi:hypothetical protein